MGYVDNTWPGDDQKKKNFAEEEEFYMLRPVNKTDHMQQGMNVLVQYH